MRLRQNSRVGNSDDQGLASNPHPALVAQDEAPCDSDTAGIRSAVPAFSGTRTRFLADVRCSSSARAVQQATAASVLGSVLPQVIFIAVTLLLGWCLLIRSRPSGWVSLFYALAGVYLLSYVPMLRIYFSAEGTFRDVLGFFLYPSADYLRLLPRQLMLQITSASLFVLGLFGILRSFTSHRAAREAALSSPVA